MFNFYERSLHIVPLGSEPSEKRPVGLWKFSLWERIFVLRTKSSAIFASGEVLRHCLWTLWIFIFGPLLYSEPLVFVVGVQLRVSIFGFCAMIYYIYF